MYLLAMGLAQQTVPVIVAVLAKMHAVMTVPVDARKDVQRVAKLHVQRHVLTIATATVTQNAQRLVLTYVRDRHHKVAPAALTIALGDAPRHVPMLARHKHLNHALAAVHNAVVNVGAAASQTVREVVACNAHRLAAVVVQGTVMEDAATTVRVVPTTTRPTASHVFLPAIPTAPTLALITATVLVGTTERKDKKI